MVKKSTDDPLNKRKDDLIVYFNFLLEDTGTLYQRHSFNLIDLLEQVGAFYACLYLISVLFLMAFKFKRHELKIIIDFEDNFNQEQLFDLYNKKSFLYEKINGQLPIELYAFLHESKTICLRLV